MTRVPNLAVEVRDVVLWLTVNRPHRRNALSRDTLDEIGAACRAHAGDPDLKALVITGAGDEAFAAGGDIKELAAVREPREVEAFFEAASSAVDEVRRFPLPVVAAINGMALGGGAELALACDYRVMSASAVLGYIHARLNISCGFGGGADLMRLLGPAAGMLHGLRGETLSAQQALATGLVDQLVGPGESLADSVNKFLQPVVRQKHQVIRAYKAMGVAARASAAIPDGRAVEKAWFVRTWTHPDHWDAVEALDRRREEKNA